MGIESRLPIAVAVRKRKKRVKLSSAKAAFATRRAQSLRHCPRARATGRRRTGDDPGFERSERFLKRRGRGGASSALLTDMGLPSWDARRGRHRRATAFAPCCGPGRPRAEVSSRGRESASIPPRVAVRKRGCRRNAVSRFHLDSHRQRRCGSACRVRKSDKRTEPWRSHAARPFWSRTRSRAVAKRLEAKDIFSSTTASLPGCPDRRGADIWIACRWRPMPWRRGNRRSFSLSRREMNRRR